MMKPNMASGCTGCPMTRRRLLANGCAACAGATGLVTASSIARAVQSENKVRIRIIYSLHAPQQPKPDWPNIGFDFRTVMKRTTAALKTGCPNIEFFTSMADGPEAAAKIVEEDKAADIVGYIVYQMNCWNRVVQAIVATGKPTLYVDFLYGGSGGFLVYTASFLRNGTPNLGYVASSRMDDVIAAARCFQLIGKGGSPTEFAAVTARLRQKRTPAPGDMTCKPDQCDTLSPKECLARLKEAKILVYEEGWPNIHQAIQNEMSIEVVKRPFAELNAAWEKADKDESKTIAERWQKSATKIENVSFKTLTESAAMYLAMKEILKKHGANAITINCLGGFYGNHIHAYPCLGFHELNNQGLVGGCESDVRSAATMVTMSTLTGGRCGFISDPVIDTASRQIIYAHCVAPNRAFGPKGPANPFEILTHSEDRQGAAVRSLLPLGYMTTTVEFDPERKQILLHQGKAVENVDEDRACRTKLAVEPVGDIEKLFRKWDQWGWHRVTVHGDFKEPVAALADALGWEVIEEA